MLFVDGKPSKVIRTEPNGFVTTVKTKISLSELKKYLVGQAVERNREHKHKLDMQLLERTVKFKLNQV